MIKLCVLGPSGRMGQMVLAEAANSQAMQVVAAVDGESANGLGQEVGPGIVVSSDLAAGLEAADVYIDFTTPEGTRLAAASAREQKVAGVIGTTGLDATARAAVDALAETAPVVMAPNFSLGVNVLLGLAEQAARVLREQYDAEVVELHHKRKRDAPSGTAIALAEALARGRGEKLSEVARYSREGDVGERPSREIGVLAVRGGDIVGEHTAYLIGEHERLEITHRAGSRRIFAAGAVQAAAWVVGKPAGLYSMQDVLGL